MVAWYVSIAIEHVVIHIDWVYKHFIPNTLRKDTNDNIVLYQKILKQYKMKILFMFTGFPQLTEKNGNPGIWGFSIPHFEKGV